MKRSGMRGSVAMRHGCPGFRCAPSGLRVATCRAGSTSPRLSARRAGRLPRACGRRMRR